MAKGSNDLNALLKAKVVKLKAELDVKGSLPKIRKQVDEISTLLEKKPVKLKVELDNTTKALNAQLKILRNKLENSKTFEPIKIKVDIDVKGSASLIKKQLGDVSKAIEEFNSKYSKQINMLGDLNDKLKAEQAKAVSSKGAKINAISTKEYVAELKEAERELRRIHGNQGNFSSFEFKDAEGNLRGFIGQLEKANGVIQKVRYNFNSEKGSFELIDQQTITQTQKSVEKAVGSLQKLKREIDNMAKSSGKSALAQEFKDLEDLGKNGLLDKGLVTTLETRIKKEKDLAEVYKYQRKLMEDIAKAKAKEDRQTFGHSYNQLMAKAQSGDSNLNDLKNVRIEYEKLADSTKAYNDRQDESKQMEIKRNQMLKQFETQLTKNTKATGLFTREEIQKTRAIISGVNSTESYISAQKRLSAMNKELGRQQTTQNQEKALSSLKNAVLNWASETGRSTQSAIKYYEQLKNRSVGNIATIEQQTKRLTDALTNGKLERALKQQEDSVVKHINGMSNAKFKQLVDERDIDGLKKYISELNKGSVATLKLVTDSKGMTRIVATMDSATKSARQFSYEIGNVNKQLRQTGTSDVFNANRNLGIMEQLRIAMARVPVWMASMTAFYGTLRGVQSMMREIVEVDKLMVDINRVASDNLNMDNLFQGAVDLSKELGNNLHDILTSLGEYARTFGDFNERQLLAITKTATVMSNVSDLTAQEATESLVGTMNAFNIEASESIRIVDALNEVDNNYAISTKQLAEGMSKTASTAKTFGVTMEESAGHITAIGAVTMESGKIIGNSLKTIYSRITTMPSVESSLGQIGVTLKEIGDTGEEVVRPVNDILGDLAGVWDTLSDSQRQNIAVTVAGRYQLTRFLALMNNYDTALNATQTAHTSAGSAMRENAKYMESFEARINQLKNSFSEMSLAIGDAFLSDAMMLGIEALKDLANMAKTVADEFGVLPIVFAGAFLMFNKMGIFKSLSDYIELGIIKVRTEMMSATTATQKFAIGAKTAYAGVGTSATLMGAKVTTAISAMRTAWMGFLASTGVGIAFVGLGLLIEGMVSSYNEAQQQAKELKEQNDKLVTSFREIGNSDGAYALVDRYKNLKNELDDLKEGTEAYTEKANELDQVIAEINDKFPTMTEYVDAQGKAHLKTVDQMKEQVEITKALSEAQAKIEVKEFTDSIKGQAEAYAELQKNLEGLKQAQDQMEHQQGIYLENKTTGRRHRKDYTDDLLTNNLEQAKKQAEITELVQKTTVEIQKASLAYQEQNGTLQYLDDSQQAIIENYIALNEETLRNGDLSAEAQQEVYELGNAIGDVFSEARKTSEETIKNMKLSPTKEAEKLDEIKKKYSEISKAMPTFKLGEDGNVEEITEKVKGLLEITSKVDENSSFDGLVAQLEHLGIESEIAKQYVADLAREQQNSKLASEAQAQGYDTVTESLEKNIEASLESLDVLAEIFGYSNTDFSAMEDYLQYMEIMIDMHGEGAKSTLDYQEKQAQLADFLGISAEELDKNRGKYLRIVEAMQTLDKSTFDATMTWEDFINSQEQLNQPMKDLLLTFKQGEDIITGKKTATEEDTQAIKDNIEATKEHTSANSELVVSEDILKKKNEELSQSFKDVKEDMNEETTSTWATLVGQQLQGLNTKFALVKQTNGELKLELADGTSNSYLDSLAVKAEELGLKIGTAYDEAGILKLAFIDSNGNKTFIDNINDDVDGLKVNIDETKGEIEKLGETTIKPNFDIDFMSVSLGIGAVGDSLSELEQSFANIEVNATKLNTIKSAFDELHGSSMTLSTSIKNMFSTSQGDFEALATQATRAKTAVDNLKESILIVSGTASMIDTSGISSIQIASLSATASVNNLGSSLGKIIEKLNVGGVKSASAQLTSSINSYAKAIEKLGIKYNVLSTNVNKTMDSMKTKVTSNTSSMISIHQAQKDIIDKIAESARNAKTAVENLNSSILNAMGKLTSYITRANEAQTAGSRVPSVPSTPKSIVPVFGQQSVGEFKQFGSNGVVNSNVISAVSTFSASSEGATGGAVGGGGDGTSGTIRPSIYDGTVNLDGQYEFMAMRYENYAGLVKKDSGSSSSSSSSSKPKSNTNKTNTTSKDVAKTNKELEKTNKELDKAETTTKNIKEELEDLYKVNKNERMINTLNGSLSKLQTKMQRISTNSVAYRNSLKDSITYQNKILSLTQQELTATENRQKAIEKRLSQLGDTSKHTAEQRKEYNKLQQEYDSNISKIGTLKQEIESLTNEIRENSKAIFEDFIDEIVSKYETAINKIKDKTDNIEFKIDVLELTNPDDNKQKLTLLANKSNSQLQEKNTLINKKNSLDTQYNTAVKSYGKNSDQAKKVKEEIDAVSEAIEDATIALLQTEKEIKDVRGDVADQTIDYLKKYYQSVKDMAIKAIEAEKDALKDLHDTKIKQYEEQAEMINKVYDEALKKIDKQNSEEDYQEQLAEKTLKKQEIVHKISLLSRDTSLEGRKQLEQLQKELIDAEKDISDFIKDRNTTLLKESLSEQKESQLEELDLKKEKEQEVFDNKIEKLDAEAEAVTLKYDNILNDEQAWARKRDEFVKGNFTTLLTELDNAGKQITEMNRGNFNSLTASFKSFSAEVKKEFAEINALEFKNLTYELKDVLSDAKEVKGATKSVASSTSASKTVASTTQTSSVTASTTGAKVTTPKVTTTSTPKATTTPKTTTTTPKTTTPKATTSSSNEYYTIKKGDTFSALEKKFGLATGTLQKLNPTLDPKKLQIGQKILIKKGTTTPSSSSTTSTSSSANRKTTTALNFRKTAGYGSNVISTIPKDTKVEYIGMENGWAKIKYNGKTGYVGNQYLKKFDTGGYTGDWAGNEGRVAMLHKKEIVLNKDQTRDILDTAKIVEKVKNILPNVKRNDFASQMGEGGVVVNNNYNVHVYIDKINGDKKGADKVVKEIMNSLKKKGK